MAKIRAIIYIINNAIKFYFYLVDKINLARFVCESNRLKKEFDIVSDNKKTKEEKLRALHEIEKSFNENCTPYYDSPTTTSKL